MDETMLHKGSFNPCVSCARARRLVRGSYNSLQMRLAKVLSVILFAALTSCTTATDTSTPGPSAATTKASEPVAKPASPPPTFRLYRFKFDDSTGGSIISYVVPANTSDDQLKSLVWLFRKKVRSQKFRDISITQPTSRNFGKKGYIQGILSIYRGEKCAAEGFSDSAGPCGFGEHDDAYYQWGVFGDNPNNGIDPNKDEAGIRLASGNMSKVFDYKDSWQPTKTETDKEKEAEEAATQQLLERKREQYANALHASLREQGYDITVTELGDRLILAADFFKDTSTRVQFLALIRKSDAELCKMGFRAVNLSGSGFFSGGDNYSLGCK